MYDAAKAFSSVAFDHPGDTIEGAFEVPSWQTMVHDHIHKSGVAIQALGRGVYPRAGSGVLLGSTAACAVFIFPLVDPDRRSVSAYGEVDALMAGGSPVDGTEWHAALTACLDVLLTCTPLLGWTMQT